MDEVIRQERPETTVTYWTHYGVEWKRMTDPAETRYFFEDGHRLWGVLRGYVGWYAHRDGETLCSNVPFEKALRTAAVDVRKRARSW